MLNIKNMTRQMELSFWEITIPLLSESDILRSILPWLYKATRRENLLPASKKLAVWSFSGFVAGLILGMFLV